MTLYDVIQKEAKVAERERVVLNIVRNMLRRGDDFKSIAEVTELSLEEIAMLAKKAS